MVWGDVMIDARSRCSIFFVFVSFASMLMLVCCSSSRPRQTSPCFQISFFSSVASHFIRLREKKEGYFFLYLFFLMFLLLFKKIWTVVAHFFGLLCLLVCFYALRYGPRPYALPIYLFFLYSLVCTWYVQYMYVCIYLCRFAFAFAFFLTFFFLCSL